MSGPGLHVARGDARLPVLRRVRPPAFLLLIAGSLDILFWIVMTTLHLLRVEHFTVAPDSERAFALNILGALITRGISIWAELNVVNLRKWGICMVGSLTILIPFGPACFVGAPVGLWTVFMLNDPEVRKHFS